MKSSFSSPGALPFSVNLVVGLALAATAQSAELRHPKFGFPLYTNQPPGKQTTGQHVAASTPALSPADAQKKFTVPKGFEMRLFAAEPDVVNPVAMSWDERGRLWVLELYEYPSGTKPGEKGRDRVKILEDTDGDGRVDKVTVFADGFTLATGLLCANGGVYVGAAPNLYFLRDTDGDGVADERTVVQTGFGMEDRHELLNGFTWGPDGQMYLTHGVFTISRATDPDKPGTPTVLTAGVARFQPRNRRLEVFAEGTSNPWGVDFDAAGNAFVSACVIDHFFHLAPGGMYQRQAGQTPYPYAYEVLPSIVDHAHHMAAYAGVDIYQGNQYPAEFQGMALQGNIHDNAIHRDRLTTKGSTFVASANGDFVRGNDGWFMPVSTQTGPDGAVWIMDWYDKYPCYQNANADPGGVDREHGRIWRVVYTGDQPGQPVPSRPAADYDLGRLSSAELVKQLGHANVWQRRTAQRLLNGRSDIANVKAALIQQFRFGPNLNTRLASLWTLYSSGQIDNAILDDAAAATEPALRRWAALFTGEWNQCTDASLQRLKRLAADEEATVQAGVASALREYSSGSLTINSPPRTEPSTSGPFVAEVALALLDHAKDTTDRDLPFLIWTALEPSLMYDPSATAKWFVENGESHLPLSARLAYKTVRRFCDARQNWLVDKSLELAEELNVTSPLLVAVLDGLIEGQRGKAMVPQHPTEPLLKKWLASSNPEVVTRAQRLGTTWGDAAALKGLFDKITDAGTPVPERLKAIEASRQHKADDTRKALQTVIDSPAPDAVKVAAVRAFTEVGNEDSGKLLLAGWSHHSPAVRAAVAEIAPTRWQWKWPLLNAVEKGDIKRGELPPAVIRTLANDKGDAERAKAEQLFGKVRGTPADKLKLIAEKRRVVLNGPVDLAAGHELAKKTCLVCHLLHGEGAQVGPDLTGVGRSSLDALLHNVIHPNEIIGQGYENVIVETRDERTLSGRLVENTAVRVRLAMAGPAEEIVNKGDVKSLTVTENSVMPEGLEQMPDADFRNLIWYILAPPQDGKPLNEERRKELSGENTSAAVERPTDGEALALWAPGWQVDCPPFEGAPAKFPEFAGRKNVLMTHPIDARTPAALVRAINFAPDEHMALSFSVAAHERGDWELRIVADGEVLHRQVIDHATDGVRWRNVRLDLARFAGRRIVLRLENAATDWNWEFAYWSDLRLEPVQTAAK